jgi:hypothetical protein
MDKNEIIFFGIIIIAYIVCAFRLDIPLFMHIMFGIVLLAVLIIAILLKYKPRFENEKTARIFQMVFIITLIFYAISMISELWYGKTLIVDSGILLLLLLIVIVVNWFFKK